MDKITQRVIKKWHN